MKHFKILIVSLIMALSSISGHAQFFKKLKERAEEAAKETILRKSEEKTAEKTSQAMDSVFEAPNKIGKRKKRGKKSKDQDLNENDHEADSLIIDNEQMYDVATNFDFESGALTIFEDDLTKDRIGDFPSKWDTNGGGEIVNINGDKWFKLNNKSQYLPIINTSLPENYTIEFDMLTQGIDKKTSSQAFLEFIFSDTPGYQKGKSMSYFQLSPCQFIHSPGYMTKYTNGTREYWKAVGADYREKMNNNMTRVSIAVNGPRVRLWLDSEKILDVPKFLSTGVNSFKLETTAFRSDPNLDNLFIKDVRIATAGEDYRSKLLTEGSISTNAILFESGSAKIKGGGQDIITEIAQVLLDNPEISINIVGHTDADGTEDSNQKLSKDRAESVKQSMVDLGVEATRIQTEGKGESTPIASNDSAEGKAQNRRVEFIKI